LCDLAQQERFGERKKKKWQMGQVLFPSLSLAMIFFFFLIQTTFAEEKKKEYEAAETLRDGTVSSYWHTAHYARKPIETIQPKKERRVKA